MKIFDILPGEKKNAISAKALSAKTRFICARMPR